MQPSTELSPLNDANRLGLNYRHEAGRLPWPEPIWDIHTHIQGLDAAALFFQVADLFRVQRVWSMTPLRMVDELTEAFGHRLSFIAVPDYSQRDKPETFNTQWLRDIEGFSQRGCQICKFWAAPRGRDLSPDLLLDSPIRLQAMRLARSLGMTTFMVHVADPDTWFATHYRDHRKYGTKAQQYEPLHRLLDEFSDVTWIAAHMAGHPEDLDHVQALLDRHPNLCVDTSATKWMIRELSRNPRQFNDFCRRNVGRVLFGSDLVVQPGNMDFDLYASRYWALRTLLETDYAGPSPIVDPDLPLLDPTLGPHATAQIRGAKLPPELLAAIYRHTAQRLT
jgi:hypothetical protein